MKILSILGIVLGAIGIFEGAVYMTLNNPMGYHPSRGLAIIILGIVFVLAGVAGFVIRSRRRATTSADGVPKPR